MKSFKVTNVTNLANGTRGFFLDTGTAYGDKLIAVGKSIILEAQSLDTLPESVNMWATKGWVRIHEAGKEELLAGLQPNQEITPSAINPIREMNSDDISETEPNIADAQEAKLNESTAPINQAPVQTAKITDAAAEERLSTDLTPIPGESPKELGDAAKFTVRAPRSKHQGAIVKP